DFDGAVGNLAHLEFEQAADKIRMASGEDDLGAAGAIFHRHDISADAVAYVIVLCGNTFSGGDYSFKLAQINDEIGSFKPADHAVDDLARAILEFLVDHLLFRLADALHHCLLGGLRGDSSEVRGRDLHFDH